MSDSTDYTMVYRIAKSYYIDGMSQQQISKRENISRPHVSRMLSKARESGIVSIQVEMPQRLCMPKLQDEVCRCLGLKNVILVSVPEERKLSKTDISLNIATAAAEYLPGLLEDAGRVGIGWGFTMYQSSLLLPHTDSSCPMTFVPLIGISGENSPYLQINVIVNRFAEKFGASSFYTNIPVLRESGSVTADHERDARLETLWNTLDAAVIGLGPPFKQGDFLVSDVSLEYKKSIAQSDLVGDILANYFDTAGNVFDSSAYYDHFSLPLSRLKSIQNVICLAGGDDKADGIIAAARNGFIRTLITDSSTAKTILAKLAS